MELSVDRCSERQHRRRSPWMRSPDIRNLELSPSHGSIPALFLSTTMASSTSVFSSERVSRRYGAAGGSTANSVRPGPGSRRGHVQLVRCRPARQRCPPLHPVRASRTCAHTYIRISIARPLFSPDNCATTRQVSTGPSGGFIWTRVPNLPSVYNLLSTNLVLRRIMLSHFSCNSCCNSSLA
jgi:hypothetical protein